ncbi:hypothetical protein EV356DRAFT_505690 [Viridothelium virens]|uniref:Uncharacterized protein n=1 Tax=Viridothelium virens TaxID=1048519 RepID=A0A6A6H320_VIRVR|nr:hypothetical protein EV356DRAFT_505690 [Viridothelium virens]
MGLWWVTEGAVLALQLRSLVVLYGGVECRFYSAICVSSVHIAEWFGMRFQRALRVSYLEGTSLCTLYRSSALDQ